MFNSELYQEKYRIKSTRLPNWDYSNSGYYFVTICTKNKAKYFGYIKNEMMCLDQCGSIVCQEIYKTPLIRENVIIDEFVW